MTDDLLLRAARALRDAHDGASARSEDTAARILARARRRARRGRSLAAFAAALAAVVALATAWAATTRRLPSMTAGLKGWLLPSWTGSPPRAAAAGSETPESPAPQPPRPSGVEPPTPAAATASALPAPSPARSTSRAANPTPAARPVPVPSAAPRDDEQDAYARAHQAHFVTHDPAEALRAWDAYLDAYPRGRFSLEARYNRALSLLRLGRVGEARAALAPFARGELGGYRQDEARKLIDATGDP